MDELTRVAWGIHRTTDVADTFLADCAAVLAAAPPGAVLSGLTAARVHGLWLPNDLEPRIEFLLPARGCAPRDLAGTRRGELRGRRRVLGQHDTTVVDGLELTCMERTWIDLAATLSAPDLMAAGDCALGLGADLDRVAALVARSRGQRGIRRARELVSMLDGRSRSRPESHLRYAVVSAGLPVPEVNVAIYTIHGEWIAEPDLVFEDAQLTLEYNGSEHAKPIRMRRDITRALDVERDGWRQVVFGPAEVFRRPEQVASYVRSLLDERDPGWRARY